MHVEAAKTWQIQQRLWKNLAIRNDHHQIRFELFQPFEEFWITRAFRLQNRQACRSSELFHGRALNFQIPALRPIRLCDDRCNLEISLTAKCLQDRAGQFSRTHKHDPQFGHRWALLTGRIAVSDYLSFDRVSRIPLNTLSGDSVESIV